MKNFIKAHGGCVQFYLSTVILIVLRGGDNEMTMAHLHLKGLS